MSSSTITIATKHKLEHKDQNAIITNSTSETLIVYGPRRDTEGGKVEIKGMKCSNNKRA